MVLTADGVARGVSFRRQTDAERWDPEGLDQVKGFPCKFKPESRGADAPAIQEEVGETPPPIARPTELPPRPQRKMYILKADIEKYAKLVKISDAKPD